MNCLIEEAIGHGIEIDKSHVHMTPVGVPYDHWQIKHNQDKMCCVTILRAGDSMLAPMFNLLPSIKVGKILIQRNEETSEPMFMYEKLPVDIAQMEKVYLLDPMLATGGSARCAIRKVIEKGVNEDKIVFINLVCCDKGVDNVLKEFPKLTIISAVKDPLLNEKNYIVPGLGDYGDRYFASKF